tara:strand:+ start:252 stop:551 length:300 start_codon:yes stop_codon:yes gene_type:complete
MKKQFILILTIALASCSGELHYNCNYLKDIVISEDRSKLTIMQDGEVEEILYRVDEGEFTNLFESKNGEQMFQHSKQKNTLTSVRTFNDRIFAHDCLRK